MYTSKTTHLCIVYLLYFSIFYFIDLFLFSQCGVVYFYLLSFAVNINYCFLNHNYFAKGNF